MRRLRFSSYFTCKPLDSLQQVAASSSEPSLKRSLSAWDLTLLGIGCIMGTGIFVLTGQAAAVHAGPAVIVSFALAGLVAALGAFCYAEMASMLPVAGSAYTYAYATLGELVAFLMGWDLLLEWLVGAAAVSVGWSGYVVALIEHVSGLRLPAAVCSAPVVWHVADQALRPTGAWINLPAVLVVLGITAVLLAGVRESARFNAKMVFLKVTVVLLFIGCAAPFIQPAHWRPLIPPNTGVFGQFGVSGVFQGATMLFFSYLGFDALSVAAQETKQPQRNVPMGIMGSLGICTLCYMAVAFVLTGVVPYQRLAVPQPMAVGVAATGLSWLETVIEVGAIAGLTSVLLVQLYAQPRILYAMAQDGFLPQVLAHVHRRTRVPSVGTAVTGCICALGAGLLPIDVLAELTSIGTLFAFVLVAVGVLVLRLKRPEMPRGFKVPCGPYLIPVSAAISALTLMVTATTYTLIRLVGWMVLGLLVYGFYSRPRLLARHFRSSAVLEPPSFKG